MTRAIVFSPPDNSLLTPTFATGEDKPDAMMKGYYKALIVLSCILFINDGFAQAPNWIWAKSIGGISHDAGVSITVDALDNVYITGFFNGTVDFDPGQGTFNLTSNGGQSIFISKYNSIGNLIWAKAIGGAGNMGAFNLVNDANGNIYATGFYDGTIDFNPDSMVNFNLTSAGGEDIFILKLDSSGSFIWAKSMGGPIHDYGHSVALDTGGNVYITGHYSATVDFNPSIGVFNLTAVANYDMFIVKLDSSGNFAWAKGIGGTGEDYGRSIALDALGNVYTGGNFNGLVDFDPDSLFNFNLTSNGDQDIFILKLDNAGNFVWAKHIGGMGFDQFSSITIDATDNIYSTGSFRDTVDFDPGPGIYNLQTMSIYGAMFISKLNNFGDFVFAKAIENTYGTFIKLDALNNIYTTGSFTGTADFDPDSSGIFNLSSFGSDDIFVSKSDSSGNFICVKSTGGTDSDEGLSIAIDLTNNVYVTGSYFSPSISFGSTIISNTDPTGSSNDLFITKLGVVTGIDQSVQHNISLTISPNPAPTITSITAPFFTNSTLTLYDITGRVLLQQPFNSTAELNLSAFTSGIYIIEVKDKEGQSAKSKVVKE